MILIADSGSTKCSWVLCNEDGKIDAYYDTIGFNPYFIDKESIVSHLEKSQLNNSKIEINKVHFYGAGCSSEPKNKIIRDALSLFFCNAEINVKHDLYAAVLAMYSGEENITCILGTGSNSCYFDGENFTENAPSLGFLIGDEASGNHFGKIILNHYFNNLYPPELKKKLEDNFETDLSVINQNIYNNNRANVYLSKYFPFITENKAHPFIQSIIIDTFNTFFKLHICCYKNHKDLIIHFIGSVAYFLQDEIKLVAKKHNCIVGDFVQNPINRLVKYHFQMDAKSL